MSLEHAQQFVSRLREDPEFRWALGSCADQGERRRFMVKQGYRFSPAELVCATSPTAEPTTDRVAVIERARRSIGQTVSAFL
jgi:predicted ribosomally synthesized peptide with nif11-like leader